MARASLQSVRNIVHYLATRLISIRTFRVIPKQRDKTRKRFIFPSAKSLRDTAGRKKAEERAEAFLSLLHFPPTAPLTPFEIERAFANERTFHGMIAHTYVCCTGEQREEEGRVSFLTASTVFDDIFRAVAIRNTAGAFCFIALHRESCKL